MRVGIVKLVIVGAALAIASQAVAGGLYLQEFATPSQGTAGAGAGAAARDASTALHNPAGMTRLDDHQAMAGGGLIFGSVRFDPDDDTPFPGGSGGNQMSWAPIVSAHYVHVLSDRWRVGSSLLSFSGSALDPDNDWAGRFQLEKLFLLTLTANPSIAYKVTDWLSLAATGVVTYGTLDMKVALPVPNGRVKLNGLDDVAATWGVSALIEPTESTRISLAFLDKVDMKLSGSVELSPFGAEAGIDTKIPLARTARASVYHELNEQWTLMGSFSWEDWSALKNQTVSVSRGSTSIPRGWRDTFGVGAGVEYRYSDSWLFQGGVRYDTSPVDADDRTADLPIDRQWRFAIGFQHPLSENTTLGAAITYANYGNGRIQSSTLRGKYDRNDLFFATVHVGWKKLPWSREG